MSVDRQEYPAMVAALDPSHAVDVLNERVKLAAHINTYIADWLQERRRVEDQYSAALRKLSRRAGIADPQELGIFATPWAALLENLDTLADIHSNLASKIEIDVEQPLRYFNTQSREMTSMPNMQGNLAAMAKEIDAAQKKADKAGSRTAGQKNSELESARAQWDAQAPFVFESLQALDENRLNHLRDVLTQLQTHEVDKVERNRIAAEQCLNILLTVETADEIKQFALRTSSSEPRPTTATRSSFVQSGSNAPGTPSADDRTSQRSNSVSEQPTPKDKPRGLRRLGTVLSRRRESKIPAGASKVGDETPDKKFRGSSTFGSLSRGTGRSSTLDPPQEDEVERPRSPLRTMTNQSDLPRSQEPPATNGTNTVSEPPVIPIPNGGYQSDLAGLSLNEPTSTVVAPAGSDSQGFSDANKSRDVDPITAAQQEATGFDGANPAYKVAIQDQPARQEEGDVEALTAVATTLKMQAPSGAPRVRGRRDNRASVYDSPVGLSMPSRIPETSAETQPYTIPETPVQTATASVPVASPQPNVAMPFGHGQGPPFAGLTSGPQSPLYAPRPFSAQKDDAGSIRSGRSMGSTASGTNKHPEQTAPGLNASIIETVSTTFEKGQLVRSVVIGEVALTNNSDAASPDGETVRLSNFSSLSKVAPNPAFLTNSGNTGTYALNLPALGRGRSQVAFKYQLAAATSSAGTLTPLLLHPQWKIEPNQASVIIAYSLHPDFEHDAVALTEATLMLYLGEGSKASSCLSKPVGTFNKDRGVIYWSLGDVTLRKSDAPQRLLARFVTEGEATQGKVEARWTIEGGGSLAAIEVKHGADDPFTDAEVERWEALGAGNARKRLVAGNYVGS